jgi:acyl dehydratase
MFFHGPLPPAGQLVALSRVVGMQDKGADKGALVHVERAISDAVTGQPLVTIVHTSFCRADGGGGGSFGEPLEPHVLPTRPPDRTMTVAIRPDAALLYRLNVDRNPLHVDPEMARRAGFERPILHGLCTYGMAARALLLQWLDHDPARLASLEVRFSAAVMPGETLHIESWKDGDVLSFRAHVVERNKLVLDNGRAQIRD